jgi:hypothetical protein
MGNRLAPEQLYDFETTLRLVDNVLNELAFSEDEPQPEAPRLRLVTPGADHAPAGQMDGFVHRYWELQDLVDSLRTGQQLVTQALAQNPGDAQRPDAGERDALHALDRAVALLDRLDTAEEMHAPERAGCTEQLRQELGSISGSLLHWEAATTQLDHAAALIREVEQRLARMLSAME